MKRLIAITQQYQEACTRYRVLQYRPYLEAAGTRLDVVPWPKDKEEQRRLLRCLGEWDVVVVQRRLPSLSAIREMRSRAGRLVFDFDDAIIYTDSARRKPRWRLDQWLRFRALVRLSDAVTAGNAYLATLALRHKNPAAVAVVPTTIELECYPGTGQPLNSEKVLGWIGSRSTLPYLEQLRRPLQILGSRCAGLRVKVVSDQKPDLGAVPVEWQAWDTKTEAKELGGMRVGLAPLPDDRWTRGKCGLRLLQYLAAAVPSVASPVGTQAQITRSGAALEARTEEEWIAAISALLCKPELARHCVAKGVSLVRTDFNVEVCAKKLEEIWCGSLKSLGPQLI